MKRVKVIWQRERAHEQDNAAVCVLAFAFKVTAASEGAWKRRQLDSSLLICLKWRERQQAASNFYGSVRSFTTSVAFTLLRTQMDVATEGLVGLGEP